jgi:membrane protease YdiL (CAAX protease family)
MQQRWGALTAALALGVIWQLWHIIPHMQQGHPAAWIWWQSVYSVALRVLMVWIYNNTGRSVLAAILVHATDTVSVGLFPNFGSHYDPFVTSLIAWPIAAIVIFVWGSRTLSRYSVAGESQT